MKKAQMEIVGLVIIVVLVALVMLFFISALSRRQKSETPQEFSHSQLATSMISTLLKTSTDCGYSIEELIKDCGGYSRIDCGSDNSCEKTGYVITNLFGETFDQWNINYRFSVKKNGMNLANLGSINSGTGCGSDFDTFTKMESKSFYIPHGIEVKLDICV